MGFRTKRGPMTIKFRNKRIAKTTINEINLYTNFSKLTIFFKDLEITEPDSIFNYSERENMVKERLAFWMISWSRKNLGKRQWRILVSSKTHVYYLKTTCVISSFNNDQYGWESKLESKDNKGLVPFRQFPVIFSSFIV